MSALSRRGVFVCIMVVALCGRALADFKVPDNGQFTAADLGNFIAAAVDFGKVRAALQQQIDGAPTIDAQTAAKAAYDQKIADCVAAHALSLDGYNWIGEKSLAAYEALLGMEQFTDQKTRELDAQVQANNARFATAKETLATYTAAQKDGRRVMTDAQKAATTQAAAADKETSLSQLHEDTDALTAANAQIQIHQKEAADADTAYKSPPPELDALSEASYKLQKAADREKAMAAADDARRIAVDAQGNIKIDNAHIAADDAHMAHPDLPATPEEKAEIDTLNANAIAAAEKDVTDATKFAAAVDDMRAKIAADAAALAKDVPPENIDTVRKNREAYAQALAALGMTATPVTPEPPPPPPATPPPDEGAMQQP